MQYSTMQKGDYIMHHTNWIKQFCLELCFIQMGCIFIQLVNLLNIAREHFLGDSTFYITMNSNIYTKTYMHFITVNMISLIIINIIIIFLKNFIFIKLNTYNENYAVYAIIYAQ